MFKKDNFKMTLRQELRQALDKAMKKGDKVATGTIRLILAAIKERDIAARQQGVSEGIDDEEILSLLQKMVKQRRESIEMYEQGGRQELADRERQEIKVIQRFLPSQMDEDEIEQAVETVIDELDAQSMADMGRVMGELKTRHTGSMNFSKAAGLVKERLG
jgi:hypothetical protein